MRLFDPEALALALDRKRQSEAISWREVGRRTDVSPSVLTGLAQGDLIHVSVLVRLLGWLDETDLDPYLTPPERPAECCCAGCIGMGPCDDDLGRSDEDDYGTDECPDCECCTRDDCNRRRCGGGSCPRTEY